MIHYCGHCDFNGHGDTDEETVDDSEQNTGDEMDEDDGSDDTEQNTGDEMDEDGGSEYGQRDTDEESVDAYEQSADMKDNAIKIRGPTTVTYGAPYYEIRTGAGIGGLLRARYRTGIGGLIKGC